MEPRCPHCGKPIGVPQAATIGDYIRRWRDDGLLTEEQTAALLASLDSRTAKEGRRGIFTPAMALVLVGGILVVTSIVLVVANVWEHLTPWGRFAVVVLPMLLAYAAGIGLRRSRLATAWLTDALFLIGGAISPFAAWLTIGLWRHLPAGESDAATGWMALSCAVGLAVQTGTALLARGAVLTLPPSASLIWLAVSLPIALVGNRQGEHLIAWSVIGASLVLLAVGQVLQERSLSRHAIAPNLVGALSLPFAVTVLGGEYQGATDLAAIAVPLVMVLTASSARFRFFVWPGAAFLVLNIFRAGVGHFQHSVGLPLTLLGCGIATLIVGYIVQRVRKERDAG